MFIFIHLKYLGIYNEKKYQGEDNDEVDHQNSVMCTLLMYLPK